MPKNTGTQYTARFVLPDLVERGRATTIRAPLYHEGAVVEPDAGGSVTVTRPDATELVAAAVITVTSKVASHTFTPAASETLGEGWKVSWDLEVASVPVYAENDLALVRKRLWNPVTDADLFERVSALDPNGQNPISSVAHFQPYFDAAWQEIERRLINRGSRPNLAMSPSSFFDVAFNLTAAYIFDDFATRLNEAYADRAETFRQRYAAAWRELRFTYDADDSGLVDDAHDRRNVNPVLWTNSRR